MKKFKVVFTNEALGDIERSYEWGRKHWGSAAAQAWYRKLRTACRETLSSLPAGLPIAPESDEAAGEVRHMIFGRYRIIFEIVGHTVRIVHVSGAFVEDRETKSGD